MNSVVTAYPDALPEATSTSLSLPESLTFEQWEEIGAELANRARKLNWWIGDWWAAGHHRYGERARLAARGLFGKEFKTLANIASVCRAFEPSRRREHLSWSHHAEASALSPNAADMLLDLAERDRMSKAQVRAAVTTIRGGPPSRAAPDDAAVASLFRAYNRLPGEVRMLVAQAFLAVAASGAEIDPATGAAKIETMANEAEPEIETTLHLTAASEADEAAAHSDDEFDLTPDWEAAPIAEGAEASFDPKPLIEATSVPADHEPGLEPATDMTATPAQDDADTAFDLTLDMAALQPEPEPDVPLYLAAEMEMVPGEVEADTALDFAVAPPETEAAFDLEAAMEEPQNDTTPGLEPETEGQKKASTAANQPWLLP